MPCVEPAQQPLASRLLSFCQPFDHRQYDRQRIVHHFGDTGLVRVHSVWQLQRRISGYTIKEKRNHGYRMFGRKPGEERIEGVASMSHHLSELDT